MFRKYVDTSQQTQVRKLAAQPGCFTNLRLPGLLLGHKQGIGRKRLRL